jgi:hypothetical protein
MGKRADKHLDNEEEEIIELTDSSRKNRTIVTVITKE